MATEKSVQSQIKALDNFKPDFSLLTPLQVLEVTRTFGTTSLWITKSAADVVLLPGLFNSADSERVVNQLSATLAISDPKVCQLIIAKKPLFDKLLLSLSVFADLNILQAEHLALSGALTERMAPEYKGQMKVIADITTDAINKAIAAYKPL
jgi:hypothetical protein